jgi:putative endonuclease
MKKSDWRLFGQTAESLAEKYLQKKGYKIIGRNVQLPGGEIDLVARFGETLIFIEVKGRRTRTYGGASYAVDNRKQRRVIRLAARYLAHHRLTEQPCRFDVVLCQESPNMPIHVEHIENAFEIPGEDLRW